MAPILEALPSMGIRRKYLATSDNSDPDLTPPPTNVRAMLEHDIAEEKTDVVGYMKLAGLAEQAGLPDLKMKMEEQAADEAAHAETMTRMLG